MPKRQGGASTGPSSGSEAKSPASPHAPASNGECTPAVSAGGHLIRAILFLIIGFSLGVVACIGATHALEAEDLSALLLMAGARADKLGGKPLPAKADACPVCTSCPACEDEARAARACEQRAAALSSELEERLKELQAASASAEERSSELRTAEAAWAATREEMLRECNRSVAEAEAAAAASASPAQGSPPPPTSVSPAQAALAVLDLAPLQACDEGIVGGACPDLHRAMRTWDFGIKQLTAATEGTNTNIAGYLEQISADAEQFLSPAGMEVPADQAAEMYRIGAQNNRQVFEAVRAFLQSQPQTELSQLDASLPRPVRGLLCGDTCTD